MPVDCWIHECARDMLGVKDLPLDVRNYLDDIEMYANLRGGSIQSRQVVSLALVHYHDRKELERRIKRMEETFLNITDVLKRLTREAGWNPDDEL